MPVIVVGTETNFAALRPRLFSGRVPAATVREVNESVRLANPEVDLDRLQPGTVLTVPETPGVSVRAELSLDETTTRGVDSLAEGLGSALQDLMSEAARREKGITAERRRLAKTLDAEEVADAVGRDKALAADIDATRAAVSEDEERAKGRAAALKAAQAEWTAELEALKATMP